MKTLLDIEKAKAEIFKQWKILLLEHNLKSIDIAKAAGVSPSYVYQTVRGDCIHKRVVDAIRKLVPEFAEIHF